MKKQINALCVLAVLLSLNSCMQDYSNGAINNRSDRNAMTYAQANNHRMQREDRVGESRADREVGSNQRRGAYVDPLVDTRDGLYVAKDILNVFRR